MESQKYIRYFISGYLNMYYSNKTFSYNPEQGSFVNFKIHSTIKYLGFMDKGADLSWLAPVLSITEAVGGTLIVTGKALVVLFRKPIVKQHQYEGRTFMASLIFASFRLKGLLEAVRPTEISTLKIPFIKNEYCENEVDIMSQISYVDVLWSLMGSWKAIWTLYRKYRRRDPLSRSYSSFEYLLTCCFVRHTEEKNQFVYYNTYDRWAFLMCNTHGATFIQHGKLMENMQFIKVGIPETAYYLSKRQGKILEKILFNGTPSDVRFRKPIEFTHDELLQHNGKKNVLLVCWNNNISQEWEMCELLSDKCNLLIKPHPGDKDNPAYPDMAEKYHCTIVPKTGYPHVDTVVSYDSTLADEYEDVGVKVIRYDLLNDLTELKTMI